MTRKKEYIHIPCTAIVFVYNNDFGNADLLNSNIGDL